MASKDLRGSSTNYCCILDSYIDICFNEILKCTPDRLLISIVLFAIMLYIKVSQIDDDRRCEDNFSKSCHNAK